MGNMTLLPPNTVTLKGGHAVTTSLKVAEVFGRDHANVLKAIKGLDCPDEFSAVNFNGAYYADAQGKSRPMYEMTKDGFTFLVMGFTGPKAAQFKVAFIQRFNEMEASLRQPLEPPRRKVELDEADYWKMKAELAELKLEKAALSLAPKRRPFTDEEKAAMRRMKAQGFNNSKIAQQIGRRTDSIETFFYRESR
jgi:Rha family phage regulatory protein